MTRAYSPGATTQQSSCKIRPIIQLTVNSEAEFNCFCPEPLVFETNSTPAVSTHENPSNPKSVKGLICQCTASKPNIFP